MPTIETQNLLVVVESTEDTAVVEVTPVQVTVQTSNQAPVVEVTQAGFPTLDPTLAALADLGSSPGLIEQTGPDVFTKRSIGVGTGTDIPTRADSDARYDPLGAAAGKQTASAKLTELAALDVAPGLVEQTGPGTFGMRPIGVSSASDILTREDGDARYAGIGTTMHSYFPAGWG